MTVIPLPARSPPVVAAGMRSNRLALRTTTTSPVAKAIVDWVKVTDAAFFNNGDSRPIMLFDGGKPRARIVQLLKLAPHCFPSPTDQHHPCHQSPPQPFGPFTLGGVCNLCNGGVRFVRENDSQRRIRFEALQSESGRRLLQRSGRSPDDISSVVLVEKDRSYIKSEAVVKIMEYLDLPFPQLAILLKMVPLLVRDFAYDNVANNRYMIFGRSESESCEI